MKLIYLIIIWISLLIPYNVYAISTTEAIESIDKDKKCNLTLNYNYDDYNFDNTSVLVYFIADITSNYRYILTPNFIDYSLNINNITSNENWDNTKKLLDDYIINNNIKEDISQTIKNNTVSLTSLTPGLYYIKTDKISTNNSNIIFDTSLINVPTLTNDGKWNYDVDIYLKAEEKVFNNEEQSPNTGDNIKVYFYLLVLSFIGLISLIVSFILTRSNSRSNS